jgi:hypothetical protein
VGTFGHDLGSASRSPSRGALQAGGVVSSRRAARGGSPLAGIVQHLPGGLRCAAACDPWWSGERRRIGHESVETREVFEVTLWTPNTVAGRGTSLDHQRAEQVETRKRRDAAIEFDGDSLRAVKGLAGSCELGARSGGTVVRPARPCPRERSRRTRRTLAPSRGRDRSGRKRCSALAAPRSGRHDVRAWKVERLPVCP